MALPRSFSERSSFPGREKHLLQAESCPPKTQEKLGPFLPRRSEVPETAASLGEAPASQRGQDTIMKAPILWIPPGWGWED